MTDAELDKLLKSAPVPERDAEYWEQFPERVTRRVQQAPRFPDRQPERLRRPFLWWGLGLASACIVFGFALGFRQGQHSAGSEAQVAQARKCYQEVQALFPNQIRAIVFDQEHARLVLSEQADVPASPPLYVKISGPHGCQTCVTFSGQQIQINGDVFEVLADQRGGVMVVGRQMIWSSDRAQAKSGPYRIEAKPLEAAS